MPEDVKAGLRRVRESLAARAEMSYRRRDAAEPDSRERLWAEGEAHAYGIAEGDIRSEEESDSD